LSIKLLRDKVPSANVVAMFALDGQESWNFFKNDFSNHVPVPKQSSVVLAAGSLKFASVTPFIHTIGLNNWGEYDEKGQTVEGSKVKNPFQIIFRPTTEVNKLFPETYKEDVTVQLQKIPAGTVIYTVLAVEEPGSAPVKIGAIKSKSKFVTSKFGDKDLFFKHGYMEEDIKAHPNWKSKVPSSPSFVPHIFGN